MPELMQTIDITREFSPYPAGRFRRDGRFSGEGFREDILWPRLLAAGGAKIRLLIDGVAGLPSSFWEEVFGGLVRNHDMDAQAVRDRVVVETSDDELKPYVELANRFLVEAEAAKSQHTGS